MKKWLIASLVFLTACEKKIDFELERSEPKLVVEATIENGEYPVVILTRSLNFFSKISAQELANSFVHNAEVDISDGSSTHRLKEYLLPLGGGYSLSYYSVDSASIAAGFKGRLNTPYTLKILAEGETYNAQTRIPSLTKRVDSIWWKPVPTNDTAKKNDVVVMVRVTDPKGYGDYVRYWTKRNAERFLPGFTSVYDDLVIDGTTYDLPVDPGIDRNAEDPFSDDRAFKKGDTVTLKLSNIDRATYDFWRTMEYTYSSIGNPFSTPVKVLGNINNGALGYFGGYASQYRTIIIPK
jgi:hypothetical protein